MTCRFEEEYAGRPYPRSCPTCGLSGKCHKDYKQVNNGNDPGYRIFSPDSGKVYVSSNSPDYIKNSANGPAGAVGTTGHNLPEPKDYAFGTEAETYLPDAIVSAKQAANPKAVATGDLGLPSGDKLRIPGTAMFSIPVNKRLKLIGYLADNFDQRGNYTIHDLDGMVDKIAAILLDD